MNASKLLDFGLRSIVHTPFRFGRTVVQGDCHAPTGLQQRNKLSESMRAFGREDMHPDGA
jgi:hypothetical protein